MGRPRPTTKAEREAGYGVTDGSNPYKEKCGAKRTDGSGEQCNNEAGFGTQHIGVGKCKWHGGCTDSGNKSAANLLAARVIGGYHGEIDIEPHDGILWCIRMAAGQIHHLNQHAALIASDEDVDDEKHFASIKLQRIMLERGKAMDQLAKYSKAALDANVAERQIKIAEGYGQILASLLAAVFEDLELTPAQRRSAPLIAERRLMELEHGEIINNAKELN